MLNSCMLKFAYSTHTSHHYCHMTSRTGACVLFLLSSFSIVSNGVVANEYCQTGEDCDIYKDEHDAEKYLDQEQSPAIDVSSNSESTTEQQLITQLTTNAERCLSDQAALNQVLSLRDNLFDLQAQNHENQDHLPRRESLQHAAEDLNAWATSKHTVNGMKGVVAEGKGLGLIATEDIFDGETLLELRADHVMSSHQHQQDFKCLGAIDAPKDSQYPYFWGHIPLSLAVLKEARNESGQFRVYFNTFPTEYDLAYYLSVSGFKLLEPSVTYEASVTTACEVLSMYGTLWKRLQNAPDCAKKLNLIGKNGVSLDAFLWAFSVTMTRNYDGSFYPGQKNNVILPLFGLLNHDDNANIVVHNNPPEGKDKGNGYYSVVADRDIKVGDAITLSYLSPPLDTVSAFTTWGFVHIPSYPLWINLDDQDTLYAARKDILETSKVFEDGILDLPDPAKLVDGSALLGRFTNGALDTLIQLASGTTDVEYTPKAIKAAWQFLKDQIELKIAAYPFHEDALAQMESEKKSSKTKTVITQITEELRLLNRLTIYITDVLGR